MNLIKRLLAAGGAAGLLVGLGGATQAFAAYPFTANIQWACASGGQSQTVAVSTSPGALVHIEVAAGGSTANRATGLADASGNFSDQWSLGTVSAVTSATVRVWVLTDSGVAAGTGSFAIHPANAPCPSPTFALFNGFTIDTQQVGATVKKTCDAGVSGNAVFAQTLHVNVAYESSLSTTITLPANLTLVCNGPSKSLPVLPVTSVITLHESSLPVGAAAAADTNITVTSTPAAATIHNAKAAAVVVLPPTGQPASGPMLLWLPIALLGLVALTGAGLVLRHRS